MFTKVPKRTRMRQLRQAIVEASPRLIDHARQTVQHARDTLNHALGAIERANELRDDARGRDAAGNANRGVAILAYA